MLLAGAVPKYHHWSILLPFPCKRLALVRCPRSESLSIKRQARRLTSICIITRDSAAPSFYRATTRRQLCHSARLLADPRSRVYLSFLPICWFPSVSKAIKFLCNKCSTIDSTITHRRTFCCQLFPSRPFWCNFYVVNVFLMLISV